mgnify:FL=1
MKKTVVGDKYVFVTPEEQKLADDCLQLLSEEVKRLNPNCEKIGFLSFDDKTYVVPVNGYKPLKVMFDTDEVWKVSIDPENEKELIAERFATKEEREEILKALTVSGINSFRLED